MVVCNFVNMHGAGKSACMVVCDLVNMHGAGISVCMLVRKSVSAIGVIGHPCHCVHLRMCSCSHALPPRTARMPRP